MPRASACAPCVSAPPPLDSAWLACRVKASYRCHPSPAYELSSLFPSMPEKYTPNFQSLLSPASRVTSVSLPQSKRARPRAFGSYKSVSEAASLTHRRLEISDRHRSPFPFPCGIPNQQPEAPTFSLSLSMPKRLQETNAR